MVLFMAGHRPGERRAAQAAQVILLQHMDFVPKNEIES